MKEISTPVTVTSVSEKEIKIEKPGRRALDFVRQFARVYQASRLPGLPGIVMNWQQHSRENTTLRRLVQAGAVFSYRDIQLSLRTNGNAAYLGWAEWGGYVSPPGYCPLFQNIARGRDALSPLNFS